MCAHCLFYPFMGLVTSVKLHACSDFLFVCAAAPDDCPEDPTRAACSSYEYPEDKAAMDLRMLCSNMPDMPGCGIDNACEVRPCRLEVRGYC
jgi:hypothetical protein